MNEQEEKVIWYEPRKSNIEINGFPWLEEDYIYRRLPKRRDYTYPTDVEMFANCTAGGQLRFKTDATKLYIKVTLTNPPDMDHMTAVGQCGFDVYVLENGNYQFKGISRPQLNAVASESLIWETDDDSLKETLINFPLYQGVKNVYVGVNEGATVTAPRPYLSDKRVIFYGTSITQGACASRPGMAYVNILSRQFDMEFINQGFSGSGKGERELALSIREIERPGCLVLDFEANANLEEYTERLAPFIELYREYHPTVPILVVSRIPYVGYVQMEKQTEYLKKRDHAVVTVNTLKKKGDERIFYFDSSHILGEHWTESTVDGIHPTDYGFMKMAEGYSYILQRVLQFSK